MPSLTSRPPAKPRDAVAAALADGGFGPREVVVRVNGLDTPWGGDDLAVFGNCGAAAVLVPKVNSAAEVLELVASLTTT